MSECTGTPISWLRLELYFLRELPEAEQADVARHLRECAVCRACWEQVQVPVELPRLSIQVAPSKPPSKSRSWPQWIGRSLALAGLAIAVVWWGQRGDVENPRRNAEWPRAVTEVKGGEWAIELVRWHDGEVNHDATYFAPGDRFKVRLTCPPSFRGLVDVVVWQADRAYFPLAAQRIETCGNLRTIDGAFTLDGQDPARVCVVLAGENPGVRQEAMSDGLGLPDEAVCQLVQPSRERSRGAEVPSPRPEP